MARITRINTNVARQILHSVVAKAGQNTKGVSKTTFKKDILGKAEGQHLGILRGDQDTITRNEFKHSFRELKEEILKHPEKFAPNRRALEKMGIRAYEGSKLRENFDSDESLKKIDRYAVGEQKEQDTSKEPVKSEREILQERRVAKARQGMNLYQAQKERADLESGKRTENKTSITTGGKSANSATKPNLFKGGTIAGASETAGTGLKKDQGAPAIPGQHASPPSRSSVQLAGGIGLSRIEGKPTDRADDVAIPRIGIAKEDSGTEKTVPTPGVKTEVTDIRPGKDADDELPSTKDIDQNLPLAA